MSERAAGREVRRGGKVHGSLLLSGGERGSGNRPPLLVRASELLSVFTGNKREGGLQHRERCEDEDRRGAE